MLSRTLLVPLLLTASLCHGAELKLKNGDRIQGMLLRQEKEFLVVQHEILGELRIPISVIQALRPDPGGPALSEALAALPLPKPLPGQTIVSDPTKPAAPPPDKAPQPQPVPQKTSDSPQGLTQATAPSPHATPETPAPSEEDEEDGATSESWLRPSRWVRLLSDTKATIELGYQDQSGRKENSNFVLRGTAEYKRPSDSFRLEGRYYYGESNGTPQSDKKEASFRWRHELSKRFFTQSQTAFYSDRVKQVNTNLDQSIGAGWAALNSKTNKLNIGTGLIGQYRVLYDYDIGWSGHAEVFEDYTLQFNKRLTFKQESKFQHSLANPSSVSLVDGLPVENQKDELGYQFRFNASIQGKMTDHLTLNLRLEYAYDATIPDKSLRGDRRISSTLGYAF